MGEKKEWIRCPEVIWMMHQVGAIQVGDEILHQGRGLCRITQLAPGATCQYGVYQYNREQETDIYARLIIAWRRPCAKEKK